MKETIGYLQAGLFTRMVALGEINPTGEVNYKGYSRVVFLTDYVTNLEIIEFPECREDYKDPVGKWIEVICIAAMTITSSRVVSVLPLTDHSK